MSATTILVYEIKDFPENGGGTCFERFDGLNGYQILKKRTNELAEEYQDRIKFVFAGSCSMEYEIKPIQYATKFEVE